MRNEQTGQFDKGVLTPWGTPASSRLRMATPATGSQHKCEYQQGVSSATAAGWSKPVAPTAQAVLHDRHTGVVFAAPRLAAPALTKLFRKRLFNVLPGFRGRIAGRRSANALTRLHNDVAVSARARMASEPAPDVAGSGWPKFLSCLHDSGRI